MKRRNKKPQSSLHFYCQRFGKCIMNKRQVRFTWSKVKAWGGNFGQDRQQRSLPQLALPAGANDFPPIQAVGEAPASAPVNPRALTEEMMMLKIKMIYVFCHEKSSPIFRVSQKRWIIVLGSIQGVKWDRIKKLKKTYFFIGTHRNALILLIAKFKDIDATNHTLGKI